MVIIMLGNVIVLIPILLNSHPGTKYGISFPVFARASFGTRCAYVASLTRAVVSCGWFGIQCWIGGEAIHVFVDTFWNGFSSIGGSFSIFGMSISQAICFFLFW